MELYLKTRNGSCDAIAEYEGKSSAFIVKKGSRVRETISNGKTFRGAKTIEMVRLKSVSEGIVQVDVVFRSASTAANFVTGTSTNGLIAWKNAEGTTLKEILSAE